MDDIRFWFVAVIAMALYGFMAWGSYAIPMAMDPNQVDPTWRRLIAATLGIYHWFPSFLAGLLARRRPILLGMVTFVGGMLATVAFQSFDDPTLVSPFGDWNDSIVTPLAWLLALSASVVTSIGGCCIGSHRTAKLAAGESTQSKTKTV